MQYRVLPLLLAALILAALLAGCGGKAKAPQPHMAPANDSSQSRETDPAVETSPSAEAAIPITAQQATDAALADAQVSQAEVSSLHVEQDYDRQRLIYEVEFEVDWQEFEYELDAYTGEILRKEMDHHG